MSYFGSFSNTMSNIGYIMFGTCHLSSYWTHVYIKKWHHCTQRKFLLYHGHIIWSTGSRARTQMSMCTAKVPRIYSHLKNIRNFVVSLLARSVIVSFRLMLCEMWNQKGKDPNTIRIAIMWKVNWSEDCKNWIWIFEKFEKQWRISEQKKLSWPISDHN